MKGKGRKGLMTDFEDIMSAITFSEAGEHETAKAFLKQKKTVLLAISDRMFDRNALRYALGISERIDAHLEILYVTASPKERISVQEFLSEVERVGFRFSLVMKTGCVKKAILEYTEKRREIQFVVIGSEPELDNECKTSARPLSDLWKKMKCPLVVVSKNQMPSMDTGTTF
jgi:K+-sensing histidine kinase KdpD